MENKPTIPFAYLKGATLTRTESAILEHWLSGRSVDLASADDLRSHLADIGIDEIPNHYTLLDAAVGRILQGWYEGEFTVASTDEPLANRDSLPSQSLFQINWANGSAIDWPATYELFLVSLLDCYVVVTSADVESFGYRHLALGHFSAKADVLKGVEGVIVADWKCLQDECNQGRWCEFTAAGLVSQKTAERWADQVWGNQDSDGFGTDGEQ